MTPEAFVQKWGKAKLKESTTDREHFLDLCRLLGVPTPVEEDPTGERYMFQKAIKKVTGRKGFADVWRRGCFGWEYKGKGLERDTALFKPMCEQLFGLMAQGGVSIVMFDDGSELERTLHTLEGTEDDPKTRVTVARNVPKINPDLTGGIDLTTAKRLRENVGKSFEGGNPPGRSTFLTRPA
ncbi:MAG: hypothetical protein IVW51_04595 [Thermaceae bacterium]|nr:hypothetical protein [Thermaceae bacterium]